MVEFERNLTTDDLKAIIGLRPGMKIPSADNAVMIYKPALPVLAQQYVSYLEVSPSDLVCKCLWRIHPEDIDIPEDHCRACGHQKDCMHHDMLTSTEDGGHEFKGRRKIVTDENELCPVHTKVGFLLEFIEWAIKNG